MLPLNIVGWLLVAQAWTWLAVGSVLGAALAAGYDVLAVKAS